jgi:hypothetical protein
LGSENQSPEDSLRVRLTAEILRAGLALGAICLLTWTSQNGATRISVGLTAFVMTSSWLIAAGSAWLGRRCPLVAWHDCLAPAGISLILAGRTPSGFVIGLGFVVLGMTCVVLASALRQQGRLVSVSIPRVETPLPSTSKSSDESLERDAIPLVRTEPGTPIQLEPETKLEAEEVAAESLDVLIDEPIAESWTRRECDGEVFIEAVVHARFAQGARQTTVHLPFIPPLPSLPTIETEPLDSGSEVEITTESAFRHGARLSITRPAAGSAEEVPIGVIICTSTDEEVESEERQSAK